MAVITGTEGPDFLSGGGGQDIIYGYGGNDWLWGRAEDDSLFGGEGNDTLAGEWGADIIDGGPGLGEVDYKYSLYANVTVDLEDPTLNTNEAALDTLISIENVTGTQRNDRLRGDDGGNHLVGWLGNDHLNGRGGDDILLGWHGDDILRGGEGADILDGGYGYDRVTFVDATSGITIDLRFPELGTGIAFGDQFIAIEELYASGFDDRVNGTTARDRLYGLAGNDIINARDGADWVFGGAGEDILFGHLGDDYLDGGAGADFLRGGDGVDHIVYGSASASVTVDMIDVTVNTGDAAGDTFESIENLIGSRFKDRLRGDNDDNGISAGRGNDTLNGRGGDDVLSGGDDNDVMRGGSGGDAFFGGNGTDRVSYGDSSVGLRAELQNPSLNTGIAIGDRYDSVEDLYGSRFDDRLGGDVQSNVISGGLGNDVLNGRYGNDLLFGGSGEDVLFGGVGDDALDGGTGNDRLIGDAGADRFQFSRRWGDDRIDDFEDGIDRIDLTRAPVGIDSIADLTITQVGADTLIEARTGTILLNGIAATVIDASDFLF